MVWFPKNHQQKLAGGFKKKNHPYLGKIPNLSNVFQWGWNHQPESKPVFFNAGKTSEESSWNWTSQVHNPFRAWEVIDYDWPLGK